MTPEQVMTLTPEGWRALKRARRRTRLALYAAAFVVVFGLGVACGLVLG